MLAIDLAASPMPIREAMVRLAAKRIVTFEPFKGYRVSPLLTTAHVVHLMYVHRLIEAYAARLAARRINVPDLMMVEKSLQQMPQERTHVEVSARSHGY